MSVLLSMMMIEQANEVYPPVDVVFTRAGEGVKIGNRSYLKDYNGLAYGGVIFFESNGNTWKGPMFVSESKDACMNKGGGYQATISTTTFNYKGKDWYYVTASAAMTSNNSNTGYLINSTPFTGTSQEQHLQAAKALLDYVYSFSANAITFCDYIESTGTQWITTGLSGSSTAANNYSIEVDCKFNSTSENAIAINKWAAKSYFLMVYQNTCRWHGVSSGSVDFGTVDTNTNYKIKVDIQNSKCYLNGTEYSYSRTGCGSAEIRLLGGYGTSGNYFKGLIYHTKFYDYNSPYELIRDFVPAYNSIVQEYVFVDMIAKCFYRNKGTGTFGGGNI